MTNTISSPPPEKPWVWTSLGTAAMIVLCCGVTPVAIITGVQATRDSSSGSSRGGAVAAKASHHPSPRAGSPGASSPSATPSAVPSILVTPLPAQPPEAVPLEEPAAEEPAYEPPREEPQQQTLAQPPPEMGDVPVAPPQPAYPPREVTLPQIARIGDTVRSGALEFVVRDVRCGLKQVGRDSNAQQTAGQFCVVTISVRNLSDLTLSLLQDAQRVIGGNGSEYVMQALATAANEPANANWFTGIGPGALVSGAFVFELPEGVGLAHVVLPGGIRVSTG